MICLLAVVSRAIAMRLRLFVLESRLGHQALRAAPSIGLTGPARRIAAADSALKPIANSRAWIAWPISQRFRTPVHSGGRVSGVHALKTVFIGATKAAQTMMPQLVEIAAV